MDPVLPHRGRETRPWGDFEQLTQGDPSTVKILTIHAGKRFSLQRHRGRDEFWRILSGSGTVTIGESEHIGAAQDEFWIPRDTAHRAQAREDSNLLILEISFGTFNENDIERLEDDYGRV